MTKNLFQSWAGVAMVCWGVVFAAGCGGETRQKIVPVEGRIRFVDGKTLPAGTMLVFNPSEGGSGAAVGTTETDGSFRLVHTSGREGAEIGKYAVLLRAPKSDDGSFYRTVPNDYFEGGVLAAEVAEGMAPLDFAVAAPRAGRR